MAFDTIALCTFSYRFNSFYHDEPVPFAQQLAEVLLESGKRAGRLPVENYIRVWSAQQNQENVKQMWDLADYLVAERRKNPKPEINDLLNVMFYQKDPKTGTKLSDENIRYQMITFLGAGHETTSGTMAFLFYHLLKHPEKLHKAQQEVDEVLGDDVLEEKHLSKFKYIEACIRETLRYQGPISLFVRQPIAEEEIIGGKYKINHDQQILTNLHGLHTDPKVWGNDADVFRPERMLNGGFESLPKNAWRAFGTGARACIGQIFAEQEMIINTALILQRFNVEMADPSYNLTLKSTLTVKPEGFKMKVRRRPGKSEMVGLGATKAEEKKETKHAAHDQAGLKPMTVFYGSNAGTCKHFAEDLQTNCGDFGFIADVKSLDQVSEDMPKDRPVIIITSSYEGLPPDNAKTFVSWLEMNKDNKKALDGVNYTIFGVGNSEWHSTFHRVPKLIDELMGGMGAKTVNDVGFVDVSGDIMGPWEAWQESLWPKLRNFSGASGEIKSNELQVKISKSDGVKVLAGEEMSYGYVKENKTIATNEVGFAKKHLEVELPPSMTYSSGDYLVILPTNPTESVNRVCKQFKLHKDDVIDIEGTNKTFLTGKQTIFGLLETRVELGTPASQRQVEALARLASGDDKNQLEKLASADEYKSKVLGQRFSVIDLLEEFSSCDLSFANYLDMLNALKPRQFSISSSPLTVSHDFDKHHDEQVYTASITYDIHEAPAWSNDKRTFKGVASTYLANAEVGSKIRCHTRQTNTAFHLPKDPETPVIMIAAGTGIAPMRAFIQERAAMARSGARKLGPALLYFGCRDADKDFIYKEELQQSEADGAISLRPAFSKHGPNDCYKYVPDRLWAEREEIAGLFRDGAKIFVCGSANKLSRSTQDVCRKIWLEKNPGRSEQEAVEWLQSQKEDRYVSDVFE